MNRCCYIFISIICFSSCYSVPRIGNNKLEGFKNDSLKFQDYSNHGKDFKALKGILLKLDHITFVKNLVDTVYSFHLELSKYEGTIGMKVGKWGVSGRGIPELFEADCIFEFYSCLGEVTDLFNTVLDSAYQKIVKNENFYNPRENPLSFEVFRYENNYVIVKTFAPLKELGYFEIFSSKSYLKITMPERDPEAKRYRKWLQHYIFYELTRGLKIHISGDPMAFSAENLLSDSIFILLYERGLINSIN